MEQKNSRSMLRHAFFGQTGCLVLEHGQNGTFLKIGRKNGTGWNWEAAKLSMPELGDIAAVVKNRTDKVSFFHQFKEKKTQIWVNREPEKEMVFFKIEDYAKPLNLGEQEVLLVLLEKIIEVRMQEENNDGENTNNNNGEIERGVA